MNYVDPVYVRNALICAKSPASAFVNRVEYFYVQGMASFFNFAIVAIYFSEISLSSLVCIVPFQLRNNFKLSGVYES